MTTYRVIKTSEALTQPVSGNHSGQWMETGDTFESVTLMNGWVKVADKRWIPLANCIVTTPTPEPDPEPATGDMYFLRKSTDGGKTWDDGIYLEVTQKP